MKVKINIFVFLFSVIGGIMSVYMINTWGDLAKNQIDGQTINQAIDEAIAIHEADPEAHLGVGESIEQHKTNEIIDHPAFSVLDDKFAFDRNIVDLEFSNLSIYTHSTGVEVNGVNTWYFYSPNTSSSRYLYGSMGDMAQGAEFDFSRNPRIITSICVTQITNQIGYILVGETDDGHGFGFKILNNKLYGVYYKSDFSIQTVEILTLVANTPYKLEARVLYPDKIEFYVNNLLMGSFNSAVLNFNMDFILSMPWIYFKSSTTTARELFIRGFHWEAELPA